MDLTDKQRRTIEQVVNVFETGTPEGDYASISIYEDGPQNVRQITYGRSQTTEYSKLRDLILLYADSNGLFSEALKDYASRIGTEPLTNDETFKDLLRRAGREDPVMRRAQDSFFDERYFQPAMAWATENGFSLPLSALVIYDSFIHSGAILDTLRERFVEPTPAAGGNEPAWITAYVKTRHEWLSHHFRPIVRKTGYRTRCFLHEIERGNWSLDLLPIRANDIPVSGQ
jgi:chitosanase